MRAAAIQMTSGRQVQRNLDEAARLLREAAGQGAALAVLPENFAFLAAADSERLAAAEPADAGPIQSFLGQQARDHGLWLVGGTIPILDGHGRARSASLLFDAEGHRYARYDKIHLFDVSVPDSAESYRESATTAAGDEVVSVDSPLGVIGMAVCYDVRFPAMFQRLGELGMNILVVPAAFTVPTGTAHWSVLLRARAIESLSYVIAAAQWGEHDGGRVTYGHSMIVGPWGDILAERAAGAGVVLADLDMMRLQRLRSGFPALEHRRRF